MCLTVRVGADISCPAPTFLLGGDDEGTRPQVLMTHAAIRCRTRHLGALAAFNHHGRRLGTPGADYPPPGRGPLPVGRGGLRGRPPDGGASGGQARSRPASGRALRRPWPRGHGRGFPPRSRSTWYAWPASARIYWAAVSPRGRVPTWRARSSRRGALKRAPPPLCAGCWPRLT
jgi:hypothetical protein